MQTVQHKIWNGGFSDLDIESLKGYGQCLHEIWIWFSKGFGQNGRIKQKKEVD